LFLSAVPILLFFLLRIAAPNHYAAVMDRSLTHIGLAIAGAWMLVGNLIMYRMVNFRI
jgi:tight adherence protein B